LPNRKMLFSPISRVISIYIKVSLLYEDARVLLTLAPSQVPMIRPPLRTNFMLLVPEALDDLLANCLLMMWSVCSIVTYSVPAVEMCSLRSEAGVIISALLTL
jgi:hypothetical protein